MLRSSSAIRHVCPLACPQVYSAAVAWLGSHGELSAEQAAATLAAQMLLKPMDGAEVRHLCLPALSWELQVR